MRPSLTATTAVTGLLAQLAAASTLTPPVLPLVVRNPYLSTWLGNARDEPWKRWPMFYTGEEIGFSVLASLPDTNTVYPLLGRPQDSLAPSGNGDGYNVSYPTYKGAQYDASTTNLTYHIPSPSRKKHQEPLELILSFLSPVTPTSTLRQSIPASYLTVYVEGSFDIDVYVDVNGQWVTGDRGSELVWDFTHTALEKKNSETHPKALKTWTVQRKDEILFAETKDRAEWGTLLFTGPSDVRHECGISALLRQRFSRTGTLQNEIDDDFRRVMDDEPVFAFSKSFKLDSSRHSSATSSNGTKDSVMFTIAHVQDPVVQYASARGLTFMRPLWKSFFLTEEKLLTYHYLDFYNAHSLAGNYSDQLAIDAKKAASSDYADIVSIAARQIMGATSFSGTPDDPILFLKEISSNGNSQTVDVIFPAFPFFLYSNPRWLAYLLEPLLEHQLSGQYPNKYSMHDLGSHFPNMTGHADGKDEYMPVEECGDMLIMGLALVHSLQHGSGHKAQSMWSSLGSASDETTDESVFPLMNFEARDGIEDLDLRWGGDFIGKLKTEKWLSKSYQLWKQWTGYLVEYSLEPHNQLCTDDFAGWLPLQTNLALKGIIGIKAMSELALTLGNDADAKHYRNISDVYIKKWEKFAISRDGGHAKVAYDWYGSWTTLYSLFADSLLCFHPSITNSSTTTQDSSDQVESKNHYQQQPLSAHDFNADSDFHSSSSSGDFIPHSLYSKQSSHYLNVMQRYGIPLDSRHRYAKSDWAFMSAAVASPKAKTEILERYAKWVNHTTTELPLTDLFETEEVDGGWGGGIRFYARPVQGGLFSLLTLGRACGRSL
ncbi:DUF1793-domain-containing protein [Aulographum hederae CBS 113979]|uniref:DUF1793-domain-containing protein n=1 Tax=Aulographum hederae CBS 113979 TaxID=1176131 RepID=A0A6G1GT20_9PEZI|nr:DUF1793-domain-containing protein [Aulographum hederae CBS 113979]